MRFKPFLYLVATLLLLGNTNALAHGDASIPLYVAADGQDKGRCSDPAAPCRSIGYALRQAGKGTQIRVAAGRYPVGYSEDLFLLVSGVVDVVGGFRRDNRFAASDGDVSILTGVPQEYRQLLRSRGFHVIADTKADAASVTETEQLLRVHRKLQAGIDAEPCNGGVAGSLPCDNVDLLAHIPFGAVSAGPSRGNDVWGFVDLNSGREYVIAGFNLGTAVFDITDPETPQEVGFIDGQTASWRDIKVFQHYDGTAGRWNAYAYVTTDGSSDGLFVIDLRGLPHSIRRINYPSQFSSAHNVYGTSTDFATGLPLSANPRLIVAGSNLGAGQYRVYDLQTPAAPTFVSGSTVPNGIGSDSSYMHDAASLLVSDARKDSQCVNAGELCEILLDFNEENVEVWDISAIGNPVHLNAGRQPYAQTGYVHSGWWSEDRQFMFVHDELDEQRFGLNSTLRVFSLANLTNPVEVGRWTGPTSAIDHNGFVRGNRYYMSNYARGLTVLDITDATAPVAVGRLDTYPVSDQSGFIGAWGAYPFFLSGTIAISDINSGVYLARDRTRDVSAGQLQFADASAAIAEGTTGQLLVNRLGGSSGAVSVNAEIVAATAGSDDYRLQTATLHWPDGDAGDRSIALDAVADGLGEELESLFLRLVSPAGGATLGDRHTSRIYLNDPAAASNLQLFQDAVAIRERGFGKAIVVLQRGGNASGAIRLDYSMTAGDATPGYDFDGPVNGIVEWADGDANPKFLEFDVIDDGTVEGDEFFELTFSSSDAVFSGSNVVRVTLQDGANQAPNAIVASSTSAVESSSVTLDGSQSNDPNGDTLSFSWSQVGGPVVTLEGSDTATVTFTAPAVTSDNLLRFQLTVTDSAGLSDSTIAAVTIANTGGGRDDGGGGGTPAPMSLLLLLLAGLRGRAIRKGAA